MFYRYIGNRYRTAYGGIRLTLHPTLREQRKRTYVKPDGRFTTWLSDSEIEVVGDTTDAETTAI